MKTRMTLLTQMAFAAALSAFTLGGCVMDDALNDDGLHAAPHSSQTYTLQAARSGQSKCGLWPDDLTETSQNTRYANHGCAVQHNIAAMIADPSTINRPHPADAPMGAPAATAVRNAYTTTSSSSGGFASLFGP
jgi:hypothetical protein